MQGKGALQRKTNFQQSNRKFGTTAQKALSDELTNPLSEQEDSAYRSNNSEVAPHKSPGPNRSFPPQRRKEPATAPSMQTHSKHAQQPIEIKTTPFHPRVLQEHSQTPSRASRRMEINGTCPSSSALKTGFRPGERGA